MSTSSSRLVCLGGAHSAARPPPRSLALSLARRRVHQQVADDCRVILDLSTAICGGSTMRSCCLLPCELVAQTCNQHNNVCALLFPLPSFLQWDFFTSQRKRSRVCCGVSLCVQPNRVRGYGSACSLPIQFRATTTPRRRTNANRDFKARPATKRKRPRQQRKYQSKMLVHLFITTAPQYNHFLA